jgi:hypothetical protein
MISIHYQSREPPSDKSKYDIIIVNYRFMQKHFSVEGYDSTSYSQAWYFEGSIWGKPP